MGSIKRGEKGSALDAADHDFNADLIDQWPVTVDGRDLDFRRAESVLRLQAMYDAERIRARAGCPDGVRMGPQALVTPGLSNPGAAFTERGQLVVTSSADLVTAGATGSGLHRDPYVLTDQDIRQTSGTGGPGFYWTDTSADYHVKLVNCKIRGWQGSALELRGPSNVTIELLNCEIDQHSDYNGDLSTNQRHCIKNSTHATNAGKGTRVTVKGCTLRTSHRNNASVSMGVDCITEVIDSKIIGPAMVLGYSIDPNAAGLDLGSASLVVRRVDFTEFYDGVVGTVVDQNGGPIRLGGVGLTFDIERCDFNFNVTGSAIGGKTIQSSASPDVRWPVRAMPSGRIRFIKVPASPEEAVRLEFAQDTLIEYVTHEGVTSTSRRNIQVGVDTSNDVDRFPRNVTIRRCKVYRDTTGSFAESILGDNVESLRILECWAEHGAAGDDAFEIYSPRGVCEIGHCVGDNIDGQICDFYERDAALNPEDDGANEGGYIHHIYGDCDDEAVQLTHPRSVVVEAIHAESRGLEQGGLGVPIEERAAIRIYSRHAANTPGLKVNMIGPMPLLANIANGGSPTSGDSKYFAIYDGTMPSVPTMEGPDTSSDPIKAVFVDGDLGEEVRPFRLTQEELDRLLVR